MSSIILCLFSIAFTAHFTFCSSNKFFSRTGHLIAQQKPIGGIAVATKYSSGILLVEFSRKKNDYLFRKDRIIYKKHKVIQDGLVVCGSGFAPDVVQLNNWCFQIAEKYRSSFGSCIPPTRLAYDLAKLLHRFTVVGNHALEANMLLLSCNSDKSHIFELDCLGAVYETNISVIGHNSHQFLQTDHMSALVVDGISLNDALKVIINSAKIHFAKEELISCFQSDDDFLNDFNMYVVVLTPQCTCIPLSQASVISALRNNQCGDLLSKERMSDVATEYTSQ
jgi:20S proteasome alpha/beta subunit